MVFNKLRGIRNISFRNIYLSFSILFLCLEIVFIILFSPITNTGMYNYIYISIALFILNVALFLLFAYIFFNVEKTIYYILFNLLYIDILLLFSRYSYIILSTGIFLLIIINYIAVNLKYSSHERKRRIR